MQASIMTKRGWKPLVAEDQVSLAATIVAEAQSGSQVTVWCSDVETVVSVLQSKFNLKASVATIPAGPRAGRKFVSINSPFTSKEEDLAAFGAVEA